MSNLENPDVVAKYVLQVNLIFRPKKVNFLGSFNIWKKSGMFGGGDDLMRFCPAAKCLGIFDYTFFLTEEEAERVSKLEIVSKWPEDIKRKHDTWYDQMVLCPKCKLASPRFMMSDSYGFNMTPDRIASKMVEIFTELGSNADVYLVRTKEDLLIHKARAMAKEANFNKKTYRALLDKARDREQVFYPLHKIIKDTSGGGMKRKFKSLLKV